MRVLRAAQKMERAAQKSGIPIDRVMRVAITRSDGSKLEIDFKTANTNIGRSDSSEWDVALAGIRGARS
jgi:hypothetical protein